MNRRTFIGALSGAVVGSALAKPVRSSLGADGALNGESGWQNPYVTDGLIAMWDGEFSQLNNGTLSDLSGNGYGLMLVDATLADGKIVLDSSASAEVTGATVDIPYLASFDNPRYFEVVVKCTTDNQWTQKKILDCGKSSWIEFEIGNYIGFGSIIDHDTGYFTTGNTRSVDIKNMQAFQIILGSSTWSWSDRTELFGINGNASRISFGYAVSPALSHTLKVGLFPASTGNRIEVSSLRIYNHNLAQDLIASNYAIDKARFNLP